MTKTPFDWNTGAPSVMYRPKEQAAVNTAINRHKQTQPVVKRTTLSLPKKPKPTEP